VVDGHNKLRPGTHIVATPAPAARERTASTVQGRE